MTKKFNQTVFRQEDVEAERFIKDNYCWPESSVMHVVGEGGGGGGGGGGRH